MKRLNEDIVRFFHNEPYTIVTTIGKDGCPHNSCKGIVEIDKKGRVYLLDLYKGKTYQNLIHNPNVNVTAVDEHRFVGYCLKGTAGIGRKKDLTDYLLTKWGQRITKRITDRVLRSIRGQKGHAGQPEALLPKPEYLIVIEIKEVVDLTPHHIREMRNKK